MVGVDAEGAEGDLEVEVCVKVRKREGVRVVEGRVGRVNGCREMEGRRKGSEERWKGREDREDVAERREN